MTGRQKMESMDRETENRRREATAAFHERMAMILAQAGNAKEAMAAMAAAQKCREGIK